MAARKIKDLAVVQREYTTASGETKKQWLSVGAMLEYDDGGTSLLIERHINFAGLPGEGAVRVSMFDPRPRDGAPAEARPAREPKPERKPGTVDFDDDVPF